MMDVDFESPNEGAAIIAAAIGEKTRAKILFCLLDGRARTSTELSAVADVVPSTASAHLTRLLEAGLVEVSAQGRHRYFHLANKEVATVLEGLSVLAGDPLVSPRATAKVPASLRVARSCYDHVAGTIGVRIHDRLLELGWLVVTQSGNSYDLSDVGGNALNRLAVDIEQARRMRRKFACPCLDWSERRPHLGGALGAAILATILDQNWMVRDLDSRALELTARGRQKLQTQLGVSAAVW